MTTNRVLTRRVAAGVLAALALVGCTDGTSGEPPEAQRTTNPPPVDLRSPDEASDEPTDTPSPTAEPTTAPATSPDPVSLPPWQSADTVTEDFFGSGGELLPVGLRVGDHDDFDRVVLEMAGDAVPGWRVGYVPEAIADGSGEPLALEGDAVLEVLVSGTRYADEGEDHYDGPTVLDGEDVVEQVRYVGTFEGLTQLFIGVDDGRQPFRVFPLADPARLVIDIRDA